MDSSTPSNEYSPEQLAQLLEIASKGEDVRPINEAEKYIIERGLREGSEEVIAMYVYYDYCKTVDQPMERDSFYGQFSKYFKFYHRRSHRGSYYYYKMAPGCYNITQDDLWKMRREYNDYRKKRKKNPNKVPRLSKRSKPKGEMGTH